MNDEQTTDPAGGDSIDRSQRLGRNASPASRSITDSHSALGSTMHHSDSGQLPAGLGPAANPAFKIGSRATITTGHMTGMEGTQRPSSEL